MTKVTPKNLPDEYCGICGRVIYPLYRCHCEAHRNGGVSFNERLRNNLAEKGPEAAEKWQSERDELAKGDDEMGENLTDKIRQWSIDRNLHTADPTKQALKLGEEFGELFEGLAKGNEELTKDAVGDMYVVLTILTQQLGIDIEECIAIAYDEIKDRKGRMVDGVFVKESDLPKEGE